MKPQNEIITIFNPDTEDFLTTYDTNENGQPVEYIVHAKEYTKLPGYIGRHVAEHLAKHLVFKRGIKTNFEDEYTSMLKTIIL